MDTTGPQFEAFDVVQAWVWGVGACSRRDEVLVAFGIPLLFFLVPGGALGASTEQIR